MPEPSALFPYPQNSSEVFTAEEKAQLKAKLSLEDEAFALLLEACVFLLQKAAYMRLRYDMTGHKNDMPPPKPYSAPLVLH